LRLCNVPQMDGGRFIIHKPTNIQNIISYFRLKSGNLNQVLHLFFRLLVIMAQFISLEQPHIIIHKDSVCTSCASISKNNW
jgi:hypothetical protein